MIDWPRVMRLLERNHTLDVPCPFCTATRWRFGHDHLMLDREDRHAPEVPLVQIVCRGCGFVRLHSVELLNDLGTYSRDPPDDEVA